MPRAEEVLKTYPHQLSGGMRQRAMIALAITGRPRVLIADEPTTALDVTVQRSILELLGELRRSTGMSLIIVTHDLAVIEAVTDRVAIVYAGMTVESGITADVLAHPAHPYTRALLAARPSARKHNERLAAIAGVPPTPEDWPVGLSLRPRCGHVQDGCLAARPPLEIASTGQAVACVRHAEIADAEPILVASGITVQFPGQQPDGRGRRRPGGRGGRRDRAGGRERKRQDHPRPGAGGRARTAGRTRSRSPAARGARSSATTRCEAPPR